MATRKGDVDRAAWAQSAARWGGLTLHVLVGVFPFAFTGLLAPPWAVGVVAVWWLLLAGVAWRLQRSTPWLVPLVPVGALAGWIAFLIFGDLVLGWVA